MVWYVDREASCDVRTVECFRCGGNHFAKNKTDPSKNCKLRPVCAKTAAAESPPAAANPTAAEAGLQDMWASFVRADNDRRAREEKRSGALPKSSQSSSVVVQAGPGKDALTVQLAFVYAELAKIQQQLFLLLSKDSLSGVTGVDASVQTDVVAVSLQTDSLALGVADACVGTACFADAQTDPTPDGLDVAVQWPGTVSVFASTDSVQCRECGVQAAPALVDAGFGCAPCMEEFGVQCDPVTLSVTQFVAESSAVGVSAPVADCADVAAPVVSPYADEPSLPVDVALGEESSIGGRVWSRAFFRRHRPEFDTLAVCWQYQDCVDCHSPYAMAEEELDMWLARGWQHPVRCKDCRDVNRSRRRRAGAV